MPIKIRLTRQGRKKKPIYHIVVADSRAPRDGRYIDNIGIYNPSTNPATIDLNFDKALDWLLKGAQPTDTCRAILSYNGVMMKKHLLEGAKKGAFSEEEANARFEKWLKEKEAKIQAKTISVEQAKIADVKKRLDNETKIKEARFQELAKKKADEIAAERKASAHEEPVTEEETPAEEAKEE
jgi:small subunit ribosomal protein S16